MKLVKAGNSDQQDLCELLDEINANSMTQAMAIAVTIETVFNTDSCTRDSGRGSRSRLSFTT